MSGKNSAAIDGSLSSVIQKMRSEGMAMTVNALGQCDSDDQQILL